MRYLSSTILFVLLWPAPSHAQVKVKGGATYAPFDPIVLKAGDVTSLKASFLWDVSEPAQFREVGDQVFIWAPPGAYKVQLIAIDFETKKVERARFAFKVEGEGPVPPGPGPKPPGPEPTDPLYLSLKGAWAKENATDKTYRGVLAPLYKVGGETDVNDAALKTVGELLKRMADARKRLMPDTALPNLRRAIADAANAELTRDPTTLLDPQVRQRCGAFFLKVSVALEALR